MAKFKVRTIRTYEAIVEVEHDDDVQNTAWKAFKDIWIGDDVGEIEMVGEHHYVIGPVDRAGQPPLPKAMKKPKGRRLY